LDQVAELAVGWFTRHLLTHAAGTVPSAYPIRSVGKPAVQLAPDSVPRCPGRLGLWAQRIGNFVSAGPVLAGDSEIMKPRFPHRRAGRSAPESGSPPPVPGKWSSPLCDEDRACCCPARPVVRVIMPPAPGRPQPVDLLLCGHHYRTSRAALAASGATIEDLPGRADAAQAALLGDPHRPRAEVM